VAGFQPAGEPGIPAGGKGVSKVPDWTHREVIDVTVVSAFFRPGGRDARRYGPGNRGAPQSQEFPNGIGVGPQAVPLAGNSHPQTDGDPRMVNQNMLINGALRIH